MSEPQIDVDAEISALALLPQLEYSRQRKDAAKKLGLGLAALDKQVRARQKSNQPSGQGQPIKLFEPEPWPEEIDGSVLLDEIANFILRHVIMKPERARTIAAWILSSHAFDAFFIFPRLLIKSPQKGCGKSTLVDIIGCLVNRPLVASHTTASPLFRVTEMSKPTILLDEADAYLRGNEEARAIVNAGHKTGGIVMRSVGDDHEPRAFSVFAPMVIAGIGQQADTVEDRSIIIELSRKKSDEHAARFRSDRPGDAITLARKCARWASDNRDDLAEADPVVPDSLQNRAADNWRPLLAVADAVGGTWPEKARACGLGFLQDHAENNSALELQALADIRDISQRADVAQFSSADLVGKLNSMTERPWRELDNGIGLTQNTLARLLERFNIKPQQIRMGEKNNRGYRAGQFADAFARYLRPYDGPEPATPLQCNEINQLADNQSATQ